MKLDTFLNPLPMTESVDVSVSDRFVDEDGKAVKFTIKCINQAHNESLIKASRKRLSNGEYLFDEAKYAANLVVECCVVPNFRDKGLLEHYRVTDPLDLPRVMLTAGEYKRLLDHIGEVNDLKTDVEILEEAKNF